MGFFDAQNVTSWLIRDYNVWHAASEIEEAGALLVRPDGYVGWRVHDAVWTAQQATGLLADALKRLGLRY